MWTMLCTGALRMLGKFTFVRLKLAPFLQEFTSQTGAMSPPQCHVVGWGFSDFAFAAQNLLGSCRKRKGLYCRKW